MSFNSTFQAEALQFVEKLVSYFLVGNSVASAGYLLTSRRRASKRQIFPYLFQVVAWLASLPTKALLLLALPTLAQIVQDYGHKHAVNEFQMIMHN
jgi:hypothetical protein